MYSKFVCYKFPSSLAGVQKESKFQKYLRLKNEQIMAKCFGIKMENNNIPSNQEPEHQFEKTNNEMLPGDSSDADFKHETCENLILSPAKSEVQVLRPTIIQIVNESETSLKTEKRKKSPVSKKNNMKSLSLSRHLETASKELKNSSLSLKPTKSSQAKYLASTPIWKSPFRTFATNGLRTRSQSSEFAYDLSREELKFAGRFSSAMKPAPDSERQLLKSGQRREYLMQRYEHSPKVKYNYPEATSWRIGWLQQNQ